MPTTYLRSLFDSSTGTPFPGLKIPTNRLYAPGLAVLNRYPLPTLTQAPGTNYNYEATPGSYNQLTQQPAVRIDYQVTGETEWRSLPVKPATKGQLAWQPPEDKAVKVRLQVSDKAGNQASISAILRPGKHE